MSFKKFNTTLVWPLYFVHCSSCYGRVKLRGLLFAACLEVCRDIILCPPGKHALLARLVKWFVFCVTFSWEMSVLQGILKLHQRFVLGLFSRVFNLEIFRRVLLEAKSNPTRPVFSSILYGKKKKFITSTLRGLSAGELLPQSRCCRPRVCRKYSGKSPTFWPLTHYINPRRTFNAKSECLILCATHTDNRKNLYKHAGFSLVAKRYFIHRVYIYTGNLFLNVLIRRTRR